jgi:predicted Rossmann-fold nucleotide-binding protein
MWSHGMAGGGPGLMEAANKGAASVPGAITAGIAISLPFEQGLNKFVTPVRAYPRYSHISVPVDTMHCPHVLQELGFQMHYVRNDGDVC